MQDRQPRLREVILNFTLKFLALLLPLYSCWPAIAQTGPTNFTRLEPLAAHVVSSSEPYPGGRYDPTNLLDGILATEYSSNGKGTNTYVEVDFGAPESVAVVRHIDRNDPATVAGSVLTFLTASNQVLATFSITNVNRRGGETLFTLPSPVTAQRARWQVTQLGAGLGTVGGAELTFYKRGATDPTPQGVAIRARSLRLLKREGADLRQPIEVELDSPYVEEAAAKLEVDGAPPKDVSLHFGAQKIDVEIPEVESAKSLNISLAVGSAKLSSKAEIQPVPKLQIFLLPHSHNDIGYTALQADVVQKQISNIETGLKLARETASYPAGARFIWNTEVLWGVDNYLREASDEQRDNFYAAVRDGQIGLDAFYCNILTGLCRPEELLNLMSYATRLSQQIGVPIESAMISDVPGYTWSTVSAMAQAGVKYFSFAPNYFDRMGGTMKEWQNRPFWWQGPDGTTRVLCWCPSRGYALGHLIGDGPALARFIPDYLEELQTNNYPYDITYLRWNVHGDNGSPDEKLSDVVKDWNEHYAFPKLIISTTAKAFRAFEARYGNQLPVYSGDYTPYWEDGAASSALETAMNRASAERLTQAEHLWAMRHTARFPAQDFHNAWRNVLLYSEHTWGAHNSISQPDLPFVKEQWKVKRGFALDADKESHDLLMKAAEPSSGATGQAGLLDVYNTCSWTRTDLVTLSANDSAAGDRVTDEHGRPVQSQRLLSGELAFIASDIPAFGSKRYKVEPGPAAPLLPGAKATNFGIHSKDFDLSIDQQSGAVNHLFSRIAGRDLVDPAAATAVNDFFYLPGSDLKNLQRNGTPRITVKERGPLVASLLIESDAPGCKRLLREVRLIEGLDRVELINTIDKLPIRAKEGLHLGYGFNVPQGTVRMDVGWAVVRPETDQIPASCKNWFSVQRWVDISNDKFGLTWSPIDAPLVEVGGITANLVGSQTDWRAWIQHLAPSQTLYSWVMNNHWHTNYRADQEGPVTFRYAIRGHMGFSADDAARFGADCSQPLLAVPASSSPDIKTRVQVSSPHVLIAGLKPSDDGRATILRLFGASGKAEKVKLHWSAPEPRKLWLSDTSEKQRATISDTIEVPGWAIVTIRAEK